MSSLTNQLESSKSNQEDLQDKDKELNTTRIKLQQCQEKMESSMDELTKLQSEKKMLLKHDQVGNSIDSWRRKDSLCFLDFSCHYY